MKIKLKSQHQLEEMIIRQGFSKKSFAESAKIGQVTMLQVCNGNTNPSPKTAKKICDALQVEFDEIFEIIRPAVKEVSQC